MTSGDPQNLTGFLVGGRYRLAHALATGGMGTVWVGRDEKLGRDVAIKVMAHTLVGHPELLARFEREARAVAALRSTHVVEVYDYGTQGDLPYMVMELLVGESLRTRMRRVTRIPLRDAVIITDQVAKGLKAAHSAGLVHRDLKPSNVFIASRDDVEICKLLDFGVVKVEHPEGSSDMTNSGTLLGTPQYMSPEQVRARREVDSRSDLWSLGVIVFRMLTGVNPFRGESVGDAALRICSDELPLTGDYCDDLPQELDQFFARAFARDPDRRFQTADELSSAFRTVCMRALTGLSLGAPALGADPRAPIPAPTPLVRPAAGMPAMGSPTPISTPGTSTPGSYAPALPFGSATPPPVVHRVPDARGVLEAPTPISISGVGMPPLPPPTTVPIRQPLPPPGALARPPMPGPLGPIDVDAGSTTVPRIELPVPKAPAPHGSGAELVTRRIMTSSPGAVLAAPVSERLPGIDLPTAPRDMATMVHQYDRLMLFKAELRRLRVWITRTPVALAFVASGIVLCGGLLAVLLTAPEEPTGATPAAQVPTGQITGRMYNPALTRRPIVVDPEVPTVETFPTASSSSTSAPTSSPSQTASPTVTSTPTGKHGSKNPGKGTKWF